MESPTPAVQDYLKAIFLLGETPEDDDPISVSRVAEALSVTAPSASNMLKRLEEMGYVSSRAPQGERRPVVELTDQGRVAALTVVRHHRLLETFLATRLGMSWDEVHREAEVLEHHISETLATRIAEVLGHPERDPHGDPIPTPQGEVEPVPLERLSDLTVGQTGTVSRVNDRDSELLRYLAERGLVPDAEVEIVEVGQFGGPISITVDRSRLVSVPPEAARAVHIA
ncbi:MAG: metal-dependent transcriptional regulator [Thermoleophilia bacterium]|nr:metal-dependent transcriptional regulator [Thermoleophilia bacterium]